MNTLDRYLLREYIIVLLGVLIGVTTIMGVSIALKEFETLLKHEAPWGLGIKYIVFYVPNAVAEIMPLIMLLASFYFLHRMNSRNELMECLVSGFSPARLMAPTLALSIVISVLFFYLQENVVSYCTARSQDILEVEIKGGQKMGRADTGNWLRGTNNRLYHVPLYDSEEEVLHGVLIAVLDPVNMKIKETYRADKGYYRDGKWVFENCLHSVMGSGKIVRQERFASRVMELDEEPEDFAGVQLGVHEMGFFQLRELIRNLGLTGGILRRYQAEMAYKLALPFSCFVLTLVGMSWSLKPHFSGISVELLGSILIGAGFMAANAFFLSLGGKGLLAPWLAGWFATLILAAIGVLLLIRRQFFPFA